MTNTLPKKQHTYPIEKSYELAAGMVKIFGPKNTYMKLKSGNIGELEAEKDMLDFPSIDLDGQLDDSK